MKRKVILLSMVILLSFSALFAQDEQAKTLRTYKYLLLAIKKS